MRILYPFLLESGDLSGVRVRAAAMPIDMEKALLFAKNRSELYGKRDNGLSWTERARAKVQRRKYEALMKAQAAKGLAGDEALNSAEAFAERQLLRRAPVVKEALTKWWTAVLKTIRRGRSARIETRPRPLWMASLTDSMLTTRRSLSPVVLAQPCSLTVRAISTVSRRRSSRGRGRALL